MCSTAKDTEHRGDRMKSTKVDVSNQDINSLKTDIVIFFSLQNEASVPLCHKSVAKLFNAPIQSGDFKGKQDEIVCVYPTISKTKSGSTAKRFAVIGLGEIGKITQISQRREVFRQAGGNIAAYCQKLKLQTVAIVVSGLRGVRATELAECCAEGFLLGNYRFEKYKKKENDDYQGVEEVMFSSSSKTEPLVQAIRLAENAANAACVARDMANEPGNNWTAAQFVGYARDISKRYQLDCTILGKKELEKNKMGGLLAVNQGSAQEPFMVCVSHRPKSKKGSVLLVGKGLTFDSGGICLKPAENMQDMKYDMCGGAAVLSAMQAIAQECPDVEVTAIVPATDNMTGASALKPGDIITHYNGTTSEIINTDAEGRLILADALAYGIEKYKPDCVIDLATLTGAVIIALGHHHAGILGTDDVLVEKVKRAGEKAGEPFWQLPLGKDYTKQIDSKVADIKNTGGRPAGTITAAAYLQKFVGETPWVHLDIAGTAWDFTEKSYIPKGPSGFGVRTLIEFTRSY